MKSIMIIEDDVDIRESLKDFLEYEGYSILEAENGSNALVKLKSMEQLPELILLDLMMPVMDGETFRSQQLQDSKLAKIPVVVTSAATHALKKLDMMQVTQFLEKPVDLDKILEILDLYFKTEHKDSSN